MHCSGVSVVDFEQVNSGWVMFEDCFSKIVCENLNLFHWKRSRFDIDILENDFLNRVIFSYSTRRKKYSSL